MKRQPIKLKIEKRKFAPAADFAAIEKRVAEIILSLVRQKPKAEKLSYCKVN